MPPVPRAPKSVPPWAGSRTTIFKPELAEGGAACDGFPDGGAVGCAGADCVTAADVACEGNGAGADRTGWELLSNAAAVCCEDVKAGLVSTRTMRVSSRPATIKYIFGMVARNLFPT